MFNSLMFALSAEGRTEPDWAEPRTEYAVEMGCHTNSMVVRAVCKEKLIFGFVGKQGWIQLVLCCIQESFSPWRNDVG